MNVLAQQQQWDQFIEQQLPTRHDERWKYADLTGLKNAKFQLAKRLDINGISAIIQSYYLKDCITFVFINGHFEASLSSALPPEIILDTATTDHLVPEQAFAKINQQMKQPLFALRVLDHAEISTPLHFIYIALGEDSYVANPRHGLTIGANAKITMLEEHVAISTEAYMVNMVTTIELKAGAQLDHYKIQAENSKATHIATIQVKQMRDSSATFTNFSTGAAFGRDDIYVNLAESGTACKTGGFYALTRDNQYIDHHIDILHTAPHSYSEMLYKGTLDKKSRAVFNGRLCVEKDAQKIVAFQANHNLLLSNSAEIYSKPELEINADDVKCKHGATTGQINQEALFYMRARGIPEALAMTILLQGFAEEITERIKHPGLKQRIHERLS